MGAGNRARVGRRGERLAARYLKRRGLRVITRNWRCAGLGEVDIVARDGDALVIVEVRTRTKRSDATASPESSITPAKRARLERLAQRWAKTQARGWRPTSIRVDLVAVVALGWLKHEIRWHKAI